MMSKEETSPKETPSLKDVGRGTKDWFDVGPKVGTK